MLSARDKESMATPLCVVCNGGVPGWQCDDGSDLEAKDIDGCTALIYACGCGLSRTVHCLVQHLGKGSHHLTVQVCFGDV